MSTDLHRRQLGVGTTAGDFDLTLVSPFKRDLHFRTKSLAALAERPVIPDQPPDGIARYSP